MVSLRSGIGHAHLVDGRAGPANDHYDRTSTADIRIIELLGSMRHGTRAIGYLPELPVNGFGCLRRRLTSADSRPSR